MSKQDLAFWVWGVLLDTWTDYTDRSISTHVDIEEYTEDSLNGGEPTGRIWSCRLGFVGSDSVPEIGKSCDGMIYWYKKYKYPLFVPHSIEP
jgi:hypothetical protein